MTEVRDVTKEEFAAEVVEASRRQPVLVHFWAPWCGPCKVLEPMLAEAVAATSGAVRLVRVDVDKAPGIAETLEIQSIPAVFAFRDGGPVDGFLGALPRADVQRFVEKISRGAGKMDKEAAGQPRETPSARSRPARIFISYRRSDSTAFTHRLHERLTAHFGPGSTFIDIDDIPLGSDFRRHVRSELAGCGLVLVVIARNWMELGAGGAPRLHEAGDVVRLEIETALEAGVPVVPVLVGSAVMPAPAALPESLAELSFRNAARVDDGIDFTAHVGRLIAGIERLMA
ncbi:MAG: TIR domain-containing protein [Rhizobiales bacterium]|nr:TIR domain-containing protein [Hyphomicrobiales bacterium]